MNRDSQAPTTGHRSPTSDQLLAVGGLLLVVDVLLVIAHLLWPEMTWGQGRGSYFHLGNELTAGSWLVSMQLVLAGALALVASLRVREGDDAGWAWRLGAVCLVLLSIAEMTRIHRRFGWVEHPASDPFRAVAMVGLGTIALALAGWFLIANLQGVARRLAVTWVGGWGLDQAIGAGLDLATVPDRARLWLEASAGLGWLIGVSALWLGIACHLVTSWSSGAGSGSGSGAGAGSRSLGRADAAPRWRRWLYLGVGAMTFIVIFLQVLLLRVLSIFGDYLTAHSVISIALLGLSLGGLAGFLAARRLPYRAMVGASLLLPIALVVAIAVVAGFGADRLLVSVILTLPFGLAATVITVALARDRSHVIYAIDLLGAALGAVAVAVLLGPLSEESAVLALAAFGFVASGCFICQLASRRARSVLGMVAMAGALLTSWGAAVYRDPGPLNIVLHKLRGAKWPDAEVLVSKTSFVGRYDVVRRGPSMSFLTALENGQITDNIRPRGLDSHVIDPRIPDDLYPDGTILILGTSGDGVLKTSRALASKVYGVEINPVVVALQRGQLRPFSQGSYDDVEVAIDDARSFLSRCTPDVASAGTDSAAQSETCRQFDMITLMNVHMSRGRSSGRSPSPEFLQTREAIGAYLDRLTPRGVVNVEEVISNPQREAAVWKLLWTMRQELLSRGSPAPEQHFFIFQWQTQNNNYTQILLRKTPFDAAALARLRGWLDRVDRKEELEKQRGEGLLGPIVARTSVVHAPDQPTGNNASRAVRGVVSDAFRRARLVRDTTDDRPFHFDVNPLRPALKRAFLRTAALVALLAPLFVVLMRRDRAGVARATPHLLIVALTGVGYFLLEIVLIQRYTIYLGAPTVTFTTVLGTLLLFSGLGSLWSGRVGGDRQAGRVVLAVLALIAIHAVALPAVFRWTSSAVPLVKVALAIATLAPLALAVGVPFPYVMRRGRSDFGPTSAALLFAVNGAASAVAVPLGMNLANAWGFGGVLLAAFVVYGVIALLLTAPSTRSAVAGQALALGLVGFLGLSPWAVTWDAKGAAGDHLRLYALNYGTSQYRASNIYQGAPNFRREDFAWWFWLVQGHGRTVLIDTGFADPAEAAAFEIADYRQPGAVLDRLGIRPDQVTDVVLTHAHWDHAGDLARYPGARVWIQRAEYEHALATVSPDKPKARGLRWADVARLRELVMSGRVELVDGRREVMPGLTLQLGGAHTPGSQWVEIETIDGTAVVSGDAAYLHDNISWHRAIGSCTDPAANLEALATMRRTAASTALILAGHEPRYREWFPEVAPDVFAVGCAGEGDL